MSMLIIKSTNSRFSEIEHHPVVQKKVLWLAVAVILGILSGGGSVSHLTGLHFAIPGPALCQAQFDQYEPFVLVDVGDIIDEAIIPDVIKIGECMDINGLGYSIGWFDRVDSPNDEAFLLDPTDGGSVIVLPMTDSTGSVTFNRARAVALSNPNGGSMDNTIIAGWAEDDQSGLQGREAVYWHLDAITGAWKLEIIFSPRKVSEAQAVTKVGRVVGFYVKSDGRRRAFQLDDAGPHVIKGNAELIPLGAHDNPLAVVGYIITSSGYRHSYFYQNINDQEDLHDGELPDGIYDSSTAMAINSSNDVVGYASGTHRTSHVATAINDPVYWWRDGNNAWNASVLSSVKNPDPIDAYLTGVSDRYADGTFDIVGDNKNDFTKGVLYIVVDAATTTYHSYWLDPVKANGNNNGHPGMVLYPRAVRATAMTWTANGINNRSAIAGSYKPDKKTLGMNGVRPCLYVPNDINNNAVPDIHEILLDDTLDRNENWLLDWAENDPNDPKISNMRIGFHGTRDNPNARAEEIVGVQAFRAIIKDTKIPTGFIPSFEDMFSINEIIQDDTCTPCINFWTLFDRWGYQQQREIIVTIRSPMTDNKGDRRDAIPLIDEQPARLDNLRVFGCRFAHMVDYMQFGNEVLGGSGHVFIKPNALENGSLGGLINNVVPGSPSYLPGVEYEASIDFMLDWYASEMEAARIGSALAGRPMRMVGPAFQAHRTAAAWNADAGDQTYDAANGNDPTRAQNNRARYFMEQTTARDNADRAIFDQHMYYLKPADISLVVSHLLQKNQNKTWEVPQARTIFEWGPQVDIGDNNSATWWNQPGAGKERLPNYFLPDDPGPGQLWGPFVDEWLSTQMNDTTAGFHDILDTMSENGFLHACYFPPVQAIVRPSDLNNPSIWWVPVLDPFSVLRKQGWIDPPYWSPLKDIFEMEASTHQVSPFTPHPIQVSQNDACPGCNQ